MAGWLQGRAAVLLLASLLRLVGACPSGWIHFDSFCLGVFEGPANWDEAKASCENRGAQLASIHSQAENDQCIFACGNVRPFHQGCWLGGTDRNQRNRKWIWVDGTPFKWTRWFDHGGGNVEPNNDFCTDHKHCTYGHTADCNVLEVSKPFRGHWLDTFCTDRQKFICKVNDTALSGLTEDVETEDVSPGSRLPSPPPPPVPDPEASQPSPPPTPPTPPLETKETKSTQSTQSTQISEMSEMETQSSQLDTEMKLPPKPEVLEAEPMEEPPRDADDPKETPTGLEDVEDLSDDIYQ